jgi:hypothetical protein
MRCLPGIKLEALKVPQSQYRLGSCYLRAKWNKIEFSDFAAGERTHIAYIRVDIQWVSRV